MESHVAKTLLETTLEGISLLPRSQFIFIQLSKKKLLNRKALQFSEFKVRNQGRISLKLVSTISLRMTIREMNDLEEISKEKAVRR